MENFINTPENRWQFFTDQVMGGKSYGKLNFVSENNIKFARMTGNVTTENNGGFIQFRAQLSYKLKDESNGIKLTVRGNNQDYFVHIRTSGSVLPWQYYGKKFLATEKLAEKPIITKQTKQDKPKNETREPRKNTQNIETFVRPGSSYIKIRPV